MVRIETTTTAADYMHLALPNPLLALTMLSLLTLTGCGGEDNRAGVNGKVSLDGQPVANGTISFVPVEGNIGPTSGGSITNGEYAVPKEKGVAVGKNCVIIRSMVKSGRKINMGNGSFEDEWLQMIPAKYNAQSELVSDIKLGQNQLDFDLKNEPPRR